MAQTWAHDSGTAVAVSGGVTSFAVTPPGGTAVAQGKVMVVCITVDTRTMTLSTVPSGWTLRSQGFSSAFDGQDVNVMIYTKTAGASEPTSYTFGYGGANKFWNWSFDVYTGIDESTFAGTNGGDSAGATTHTASTVTTTVADELCITCFAVNAESGGVPSGPSGIANRARFVNGSNTIGLDMAEFNQASAGATTAVAITTSGSRKAGWATVHAKPTLVLSDADTELLKLTPSAVDVGPYTEAVTTEALALTASGSETSVYLDVGTESLKLDATTSIEGPPTFTDQSTENLLLTPSSTDVFTHLYVDANTETLKFTPLGLESQTAYLDTAIESFALVGSAVETKVSLDSGIEALRLSPTADMHYCPSVPSFNAELDTKWDFMGMKRWEWQAESRWASVFLGVAEGFAC